MATARKMTFRGSTFIEMILDHSAVQPICIELGEHLYAALKSVWEPVEVLGIPVFPHKELAPYDTRFTWADGEEEVIGPEPWMEPEQPPGSVAEVKQVEYTENEEGEDHAETES